MSKATNWVYAGMGGVIAALMLSAWEQIRPMTKAEHDADFVAISEIQAIVSKLDRHWDCYETDAAIAEILRENVTSAMDSEMLRQLRERRTSLSCAGL